MSVSNVIYSAISVPKTIAQTAVEQFGGKMIAFDLLFTGGLFCATFYSGARVYQKIQKNESGVARQVLITACLGAALAGTVLMQTNSLINDVYPSASKKCSVSARANA